jgi:2,3-bisphosphoglycerate-independent phosphoglycerate mutase
VQQAGSAKLLISRRGGLSGIDATLGVPGRPQSGTGQTALLTGRNAAEMFGRHFGPWVPTSLRQMLAEESILRPRPGRSIAFADATPRRYLETLGPGWRRPGVFPYAAYVAGLLTRDELSVRAGDAIPSSIVTDRWRVNVDPLSPLLTPMEAGRVLASIASRHDLTVFAHFDTDHVGHRENLDEAIAAVERVDGLLEGLLADLPSTSTLLVTSDHGNIEDITTGHTLNPALFLVAAERPGELLERVHRISDVAPLILDLLADRELDPRTGRVPTD